MCVFGVSFVKASKPIPQVLDCLPVVTPLKLYWLELAASAQITQPSLLQHKNSLWFYNGDSTCVSFSNDDDRAQDPYESTCDFSRSFCAGARIAVSGTQQRQIEAVKTAIHDGGVHAGCPSE